MRTAPSVLLLPWYCLGLLCAPVGCARVEAAEALPLRPTSTAPSPVSASPVLDCDREPCVHGTCAGPADARVCACAAGWTGDRCEQAVIDGCDPDPCVHGACTGDGEGYSCACASGWTGPHCDQQVASACEAAPCMRGTCEEVGSTYTCSCEPGWTGPSCDQALDACEPNPCVHGVCVVEHADAASCVCNPGWVGEDCDTVDPCPGFDDSDADGDGTPDGCDPCPTDPANDPDEDGFCNALGTPITLHFQSIAGGSFMQGSQAGDGDEVPVHEVTVTAFEIMRTEVTVAQYAACVDVGACAEPPQGEGRNWNDPGYEDHPVNAVSMYMGAAYCAWAGGRLPTESEWEYAARSGGQDITYPWGDAEPTCALASFNESGTEPHCGTGRTSPACSRPLGNTAQSLCDMAGNVREWVQDRHHFDYIGAPSDGSAWGTEDNGSRGVNRGGSGLGGGLRAADRFRQSPSAQNIAVGFRCVRERS